MSRGPPPAWLSLPTSLSLGPEARARGALCGAAGPSLLDCLGWACSNPRLHYRLSGAHIEGLLCWEGSGRPSPLGLQKVQVWGPVRH